MNNKVILVDIISARIKKQEATLRTVEFNSLISTYGNFDIVSQSQKKFNPKYDYYIGSGKADVILKEALDNDVSFIIINNELKPHQLWNLQELFEKTKAEYMEQHKLNNEEYKSDVKTDRKIEIWGQD